MSRSPRIDFPDALYHVISRGNGREDIFWADDDRHRFVQQLADGIRSAGVLYEGYVCAKRAADFVCYDMLRDHGRSLAAARRNYRASIQAYVVGDDRPLLDAMKANRYAIGGPEFVTQIERQLQGRRSGRPQDADVDLPRLRVDIERIDALVAAWHGVEPADADPSPRKYRWSRNSSSGRIRAAKGWASRRFASSLASNRDMGLVANAIGPRSWCDCWDYNSLRSSRSVSCRNPLLFGSP